MKLEDVIPDLEACLNINPQHHMLLSLPMLLLGFYIGFSSAIIMFISSTMLDFDHVLNFWMSSGKLDRDFKRIYRLYTVDAAELKKIIDLYLPFHSFEFVLALPVIALILGIPMIGLALSLGILFHLVIDIHWWRTKLFKGDYWNAFLFYWFAYRLKKHFNPYTLTS